MVLLTYLSLSVALGTALAAPIGTQGAIVDWVPESLKPLQRAFIDYINPIHTPSVNQTITACLVFIFISALSAGPPVIRYPKGSTWVKVVTMRLGLFLYGFISPDHLVMGSWRAGIEARSYALLYNKLFHKEDPKGGWSKEHGAFLVKGGFVLWEDNKPVKALAFKELTSMIKAGEIDPPAISKEDILARTTKTHGHIAVFFTYFSVLWFSCKFSKSNIVALVELATVHANMCWWTFLWRSNIILSVVEPVVIMRKSQEKVKEALVLEDAAEQKELSSEMLADFTDPEDEKAEVHPTEPAEAPANTPDRNTAFDLVWGQIVEILVAIISLLLLFMRATRVSMSTQWRTISSPYFNFVTVAQYMAQTVVTLLCWCIALGPIRRLSSLSEIEQTVWRVSCYFLMLQPVILLLAPARVRVRIRKSVKTAFYVLYSILYSAARLSVFFIAFYSIRYAV